MNKISTERLSGITILTVSDANENMLFQLKIAGIALKNKQIEAKMIEFLQNTSFN